MQEDFTNSLYSKNKDENSTPRELYNWASNHTRLCQSYTGEHDLQVLQVLKEKIDESLKYGKILLNSLHDQTRSTKSLIPPSGMNRFGQTKELLNTKDVLGKNPNCTYKADLGTSSNLKSMPLPSRTYIKKKNASQ